MIDDMYPCGCEADNDCPVCYGIGQFSRSDIRDRLCRSSSGYAIALQRCIEHAVAGLPIPDDIAAQAPHHAAMLHGFSRSPTPADAGRTNNGGTE